MFLRKIAILATLVLASVVSACSSSDPREKAVEDLYLSIRSGEFARNMVENQKERLMAKGTYEETLKKVEEQMAEIRKEADEKFGTYKGMEVLDMVQTGDDKYVYYVNFKGSKEDNESYFVVEKKDGEWEPSLALELTYKQACRIRDKSQKDGKDE